MRGIGLLNSANKGYYNFNGHGDVVGITDSFGLVMQEYDYDAFGVLKSDNVGDDNPFRYCGEYLDLESGMVYLRHRHYNPTSGRFMTEDAVRSNFNWYTYVNNNPIMLIDPFGLEAVALRDYVESRDGTVAWDKKSKNITVSYRGIKKVYNSRQYSLSGGIAHMDSGTLQKHFGFESTNYAFNSKLVFSGYIYDQYSGNASILRIGDFEGSYNGCGPIAAYNALKILGTHEQPSDIINYLEKNSGFSIEQGKYGTRAYAIMSYFGSLGYKPSLIHDTPTSIDDVIDSSKASILRFGYDDSFYQHYVAIQPVVYNGLTTYRVYNQEKGATTYKTLTSVDEWMKENGYRFINLTTVK